MFWSSADRYILIDLCWASPIWLIVGQADQSEFEVWLICVQVDRLEDELMGEQEKLKGITEELEQTFAEMSGY